MESVLPCGMPSVIVCVSDCACSVWSVCVRLLKYEVRSEVVLSSKLKVCFSLWRSLVWEMVSYAFERSGRWRVLVVFFSCVFQVCQ